jgi:uncharacterized protein (TIGR00369 family)
MMTDDFEDENLLAWTGEGPSGYQSAMAYRLAEWREGEAVIEMEIRPRHLNRVKVVHGGVLASLIDTACGFCGSYSAVPGEQRGVATLSLTTSFTAPAQKGLLRTIARKRGGGASTFFASAEIYDGAGVMVAFGEGTFRYRKRRIEEY